MDELETQVRDELVAIRDVLQESIGWPSRWTGEVEILDDSMAYGHARWGGRIAVSRDIIQSDARWRTQIHELLHTFSVGLTPDAYSQFRGWEEGTVEQLQRHFRPLVLGRLSLPIPDHFFAAVEKEHSANRYIETLNAMGGLLGQPSPGFFISLLGIPLANRPAYVLESGHTLPVDRQAEFRRYFASSFSLMRGGRFHVRI